jgi:hypothetical protein
VYFVLQSETDSTLDSKDNTPTPQSHSVIPGSELAIGEPSANHEAKPDGEGNAGSPETVEKKSLTPGMMSSGYSSTVGLEDITSVQKSGAASDEGGIVTDGVDNAKTSCLIDSAIPSDLGSPLKPSTPYCERQTGEEFETDNNRNVLSVTSELPGETDANVLNKGDVNEVSRFQDTDESSVIELNHVNDLDDARRDDAVETGEERVSYSADSYAVDKADAAQGHADGKEARHSNGTDGERGADTTTPAVVRLPPTNTSGKLRPRQADRSSEKPASAPMKATYRPLSMPPEMLALEDKDRSFGSQDEVSEQGLSKLAAVRDYVCLNNRFFFDGM